MTSNDTNTFTSSTEKDLQVYLNTVDRYIVSVSSLIFSSNSNTVASVLNSTIKHTTELFNISDHVYPIQKYKRHFHKPRKKCRLKLNQQTFINLDPSPNTN